MASVTNGTGLGDVFLGDDLTDDAVVEAKLAFGGSNEVDSVTESTALSPAAVLSAAAASAVATETPASVPLLILLPETEEPPL